MEGFAPERAHVAGDPRTRDGSLGLHAADDGIPPMEWPFSLVEADVFRAAGVARRDEAEGLATAWLGAMVVTSTGRPYMRHDGVGVVPITALGP